MASTRSAGSPGGTRRASTSSFEDLGDAADRGGHNGQPDAGGLHQRHGETLVKRGQDKGVGARQQFQHVIALAEELEPVAQRQFGVTCAERGAQRAASYRSDPEWELASAMVLAASSNTW
jgi:hypothetical protein